MREVALPQRVVPIVACDRCGAAKVLGSICFVCAKLINITNARGACRIETRHVSASAAPSALCPTVPPHGNAALDGALFKCAGAVERHLAR